jgi:WD40 repeat protein
MKQHLKSKKSIMKVLMRSLLLIFLCIIFYLGWYQLFYHSPRLDAGIASKEFIFKGHRNIVTAVRFFPNDQLMITSSVDSTVRIWERSSGRIVREIRQPEGISYMDLSTDGQYIVTGSYDSEVRLYRVSDGRLLHELKGSQGTIWTVAISADGKRIASSGDDALIRIWDAETGTLLRILKGHNRIVWSVKFSPDGTQLASGSFDWTFKLWNLQDGKIIWDNHDHAETVVDLAFSHNGNMLATTSDDKTIRVWNVNEMSLLKTMKVEEHVQAVAFSPDDKRVMTGGRDKPMPGELLQNIFGDSHYNPGVSARLWDVSTGQLLETFQSHANDVMDVAYSHDGNWVATASADHTVEVWRIRK